MWVLLYSLVVVLLDQISKYLVKHNFTLHSSTQIVGDFFRVTYVENSGIAFGIRVGNILPFFTVLSFLAAAAILYYIYRERDNHLLVRISLALILGGAIGNLVDRVLFGRVVDFLDFGLGGYRFFIFNLADTSVTLGIILFLGLTTLSPLRYGGQVSQPEYPGNDND